jgi:antitoxin (DNA-binding transcriptional repressor) of toxin-antitoxin stability system
MRFVSVRGFRSRSAEVWRRLATEKDMVVTSRGSPVALLTAVSEDDFEESLAALRRARAMTAVHAMQMRSEELGLGKLTMDEIDAEVAAYRGERRK